MRTFSAQMITTAIAVNTDGAIVLSEGATYGILLAILFSHGIVCSAATKILARLNLIYVLINGKSFRIPHLIRLLTQVRFQLARLSQRSSVFWSARETIECRPKMLLLCSKTTPVGRTVSIPIFQLLSRFKYFLDGWAFLLAFTAPMWTLTGCTSP